VEAGQMKIGPEKMTPIIHIPHSSTCTIGSGRDSILLDTSKLARELLLITDHFTDELFYIDGLQQKCIIFPVSRLIVDPERFEDDSQESMATRGMGVIYTHTADGTRLRADPSPSDREHLLNLYYRPHHAKLTSAVEKDLESIGGCLIIDAHSFPSKPLPYELDQSPDRPDICIGTDPFHTPAKLTEAAVNMFAEKGFSVQINRPFAGTITPSKFYQSNNAVRSIMIEINRKLYMDEETGEKNDNFKAMTKCIRSISMSLMLSI
jgi:N-formylglutamate amidohydrolase